MDFFLQIWTFSDQIYIVWKFFPMDILFLWTFYPMDIFWLIKLVWTFPGANIVFESRRRRAGLVFQNLAFSGWVSHNTRVLYLEISCRNDVTNLWLSFSIPTKNCVKAQTDLYSKFIHPYIAICKVSLKTVSEECL